MLLRIFYIFIALAALYLSYDIYRAIDARGNIANADAAYIFGPEDADLTVVEFFDYTCPYCREVHPTITEAVKQDGKVRYIPRAIPPQSEEAVMAIMVAEKAAQHGKFFEMHDQLMKNYLPITDRRLSELSFEAGLDLEEVDAEFDESAIIERLRENSNLFKLYGGQATPMFVIGKDMVYVPEGRMPTVEDFLRMFNEARGKS